MLISLAAVLSDKCLRTEGDDFCKKGNGRIFVKQDSDIDRVHDILKSLDEDEYNNHLPKKFCFSVLPLF